MYENDPVPGNILTSCDAVALNKWLSLFVIESVDFYWKPKDVVPAGDSAFWFIPKSCGRNFLAT